MNASLSLTTAQAERRQRTTVVVVCYLIFVVLGMPDGMLGVVFPSLRREFGLGLDAFGWIFVFTTVGFLVSSFLVGYLLNRFQTVHFLIAAGLLRIVGLVGYSLLPTWAMVIPVALLTGFASGLFDAGLNTWFAMRFSPRLMNWLHASFGLGATLGPLIATYFIATGLTWRYGFVVMALLQLTIVGVLLATRASWSIPPSVVPPDRVDGKPHISPARTLLIPAVWLGIAVFFFYTGVELTTANYATSIFTEGRGLDLKTAGYVTTAFWLIFTLGRVFFGFIEPRSIANLVRACMVAALVGAIFLAWGPYTWGGVGGLLLIGFATAPIFPLLVSETPLRLGAEVAQHAIGFQVGAASLGIAVLPTVAGIIAERTSVEAIPLFVVGVAVVLLFSHEIMIRMHGKTSPSH